jgi:hypothetical protein
MCINYIFLFILICFIYIIIDRLIIFLKSRKETFIHPNVLKNDTDKCNTSLGYACEYASLERVNTHVFNFLSRKFDDNDIRALMDYLKYIHVFDKYYSNYDTNTENNHQLIPDFIKHFADLIHKQEKWENYEQSTPWPESITRAR